MLQKLLERLEPENVYEQSRLPKTDRSLRMRLSDVFYHLVKRWL